MAYNNQVPTYESLLEFQEVYLRAIALAWTDQDKDAEGKTFKDHLLENPQAAMEKWLAYKCPWDIDIDVREATEGAWHEGDGAHWELPKNTMTIGLPSAPEKDQEAIALAAWNDSGPTYMFTCC